jgi:hypothetical protein
VPLDGFPDGRRARSASARIDIAMDLHDRQISGLLPLENSTSVNTDLTITVSKAHSVTDQATRRDKLALRVDRADRAPCLSWLAFPSAPALRSTNSAADRSALFARDGDGASRLRLRHRHERDFFNSIGQKQTNARANTSTSTTRPSLHDQYNPSWLRTQNLTSPADGVWGAGGTNNVG